MLLVNGGVGGGNGDFNERSVDIIYEVLYANESLPREIYDCGSTTESNLKLAETAISDY